MSLKNSFKKIKGAPDGYCLLPGITMGAIVAFKENDNGQGSIFPKMIRSVN
jgi:hypothetical protein